MTTQACQRTAKQLGSGFPKQFLWGVGTAAYQTEGGATEGGRGESIWDDFCAQPDRIVDGTSGAIAADHYHRWLEDIKLMTQLGVNAYRFSVAWPRIQPTGVGKANQQGIAFYDRVVDGLCEAGIEPVATLFHWDLPAALQNSGGWMARETSHFFEEYASHVGSALGDRVKNWFTIVEPYILLRHSHILGEHAPGLAMQTGEAFPALHHLLLAHGLASKVLRERGAERVGITNHPSPCKPASTTEADIRATRIFDDLRNNLVTDAVLTGRYPDSLQQLTSFDNSTIQPGDMETISTPIEYLGLTYYHPSVIRAPEVATNEPFESVRIEGLPMTTMDWPINSQGMAEVIESLSARYGDKLPPIVITENGCSCEDELDQEGSIHDRDRIEFLDSHLSSLQIVIDKGIQVDGYFYLVLPGSFRMGLGFYETMGHLSTWIPQTKLEH